MSKYNPKEFESKHYKNWIKYFKSENESNNKPFSMILPPPNVTGVLHMGHALTVTIQDIIVRYKRMCGFNTTWVPGTDHAGIATQMVVERELLKKGISRHELGREKFLKKVWEVSTKHHDQIINQLKTLGVSLDWDRERFSLDEKFNNAVIEIFISLYKKNLLYRSEKLISWCTRCGTALSDLEVANIPESGYLYYIKYFIKDNSSNYVVIATTRPETLLGDTAIAVHPDDDRYKKLQGKKVQIPFTGRTVPIIIDEYVDSSFGTGCLKITPAHDFNDYEIGIKHGLDFITVISKDGKMINVNKDFLGLSVSKAREKIIHELKKNKQIEKIENYELSLSKCSRCDSVVEPILSKQWFVKMENMAKQAIKVVKEEKVKFYPRFWWEQTYYNWLENIRDWCVSRQLWWGHRIPVWYCKVCDKFYVSKSDPQKCDCGSKELYQDSDVLDTWFSAALWPFVAFGWPNKTKELKTFYPNSLMETGFDIIFFWVARMIMFGLEFIGEVPFKDVLFHAMIRDEKGNKMSKTKGNVIDPLDIINKFGADTLRLSLASYAGSNRDIKLSNTVIENYHFFMNKIWQASNFVFNNINDTNNFINFSEKNIKNFVNKAIISIFYKLVKNVHKEFKTYSLNNITELLFKFFKNDFCDKYLECSKILLKDDEYKNETSFVLSYIHIKTMILMHPFVPFITEELYQKSIMKKFDSIMEEAFLYENDEFINNNDLDDFYSMFEIISSIRNIRNMYNIKQKILIYLKTNLKNVSVFYDFIKKLALVHEIRLFNDDLKIDSSIRVVLKESEIVIPAKDYLNFELEISRINKNLEKVNKDFKVYNGKLSNPKFLNNAKPEVISKDKEKLEEITKIKFELENALKTLGVNL